MTNLVASSLGRTLLRPLLCFYLPLLVSEVWSFVRQEEKSDIDILTALRYASICAVSLLAVIVPLLAQRLKLSMKADILLLAPHLLSIPLLLTHQDEVGPSNTVLFAALVSFDLPVSLKLNWILPILAAASYCWLVLPDALVLLVVGLALVSRRQLSVGETTWTPKEAFAVMPIVASTDKIRTVPESLLKEAPDEETAKNSVKGIFADDFGKLEGPGILERNTSNVKDSTEITERGRCTSSYMQSAVEGDAGTQGRLSGTARFMQSDCAPLDQPDPIHQPDPLYQPGPEFKIASSSVDADERADVVYQDDPSNGLLMGIPGSPFNNGGRSRVGSENSVTSGWPQPRPRMQSEGERSNWSDNTLTYSVSVPSSSPSLQKISCVESSTQTMVVWKESSWHCTQCARPPLPRDGPTSPLPPAKSSSFQGALEAKLSKESKRRALSFMEQLQGEWRLCSSSAGRIDQVADWLKVFQIDQTVVSSKDGTKQQLEFINDIKVCMCGGELKLDNLGYLHRHGRSGQHLVFAPSKLGDDEDDGSPCSVLMSQNHLD